MQRLVGAALSMKEYEQRWAETLIGSVLGNPEGEDSNAGRISRTYTNNYKSLDQFDALWYEIAYYKRDVHWETVFIWAMVLDSIINGRAMYCEAKGLKLRIGPCVKMTNLVKKTNLPKKLKLLFKRVKKGSSTFAIHYLR